MKHNYYDKASIVDEAFNTLRTNIQFSEVDKKLKTIVVTSASPSEGKTTVAVRLARSFAQTSRVLVVDCDLRNPSMPKAAGVQSNMGLTHILVQHVDPREVLVEDENYEKLDYILAGPVPPNPAVLVGTDAMKRFVARVSDAYDYVIIDSAPVGLFSDAAILSTFTDGVILVADHGATTKAEFQNAKERIEHVRGNVLGAVLNRVDISTKRGAKNYYNSR